MYWFERIIQRLEDKYSHCAIFNLTLYIVSLNAIVYVLNLFNPYFVQSLTFNLNKILQGEVWRIITYIVIPPNADFIFIFFALYFLYWIGSGLEGHWGSFRFNFYYLIGMIGTTIVGCFFPYGHISNVYLNTSLFLAFATLYPEFQVHLFLIIPIKMKYLAIISWIGIIASIVLGPLSIKFVALISIVNYVLFFWPHIIDNMRMMHRQSRQVTVEANKERKAFHGCGSCGVTEKDNEHMEFRVCSQCHKEYCIDHIKNHACKE